jgi:hypothetical protein
MNVYKKTCAQQVTALSSSSPDANPTPVDIKNMRAPRAHQSNGNEYLIYTIACGTMKSNCHCTIKFQSEFAAVQLNIVGCVPLLIFETGTFGQPNFRWARCRCNWVT